MAEKITKVDSNLKNPVARIKLAQFSWASGETAAVTKMFPFNGIVRQFHTVINDNTGNRTATVAIVDEDSYPIHSTAAIPENATTTTTLTADTEAYVPSGCNVTVTPSGDPGEGGMTVDVTFIGYSPATSK